MYSYTSMTDWHSLASFPSNEPNSPSSIVGLVVAALLVALLVWIARRGSLVSGIAAGAVVFALASAALFWPRVLREPYAPNPGPLLVLIGAFAGGCCGAVSALLGKVVQELSYEIGRKTRKVWATRPQSLRTSARPTRTVRIAERTLRLIRKTAAWNADGRSTISSEQTGDSLEPTLKASSWFNFLLSDLNVRFKLSWPVTGLVDGLSTQLRFARRIAQARKTARSKKNSPNPKAFQACGFPLINRKEKATIIRTPSTAVTPPTSAAARY